MLARIQRWARTTRRGDLAEIRGLSDTHPVWPQVTSTRENCLGQRCPEFARCHVVLARREALEADIVIVNHHLLLADLALKEDGFGDLLGSADAVMLDEAHQMPDLATQFFGAHVSSRQLETLLKDLRLKSELTRRRRRRGGAAAAPCGSAARCRGCAAAPARRCRRRHRGRDPWADGASALVPRRRELRRVAARSLHAALAGAGEDSPLAQFAERAAEVAASLAPHRRAG